MPLPSTTVKDFGGGWNTSDSDLNLSSRYQPVSDNVVRGIDGSFSVRQGCALWNNFEITGTEVNMGALSPTFAVTNTNPKVTITFAAAHGLVSGNHLTISGITTHLAGIDPKYLNGTHGVVVTSPTVLFFYAAVAANATVSQARNIQAKRDTRVIGGEIIHNRYFNGRLVVFTDSGEIGTCDEQGNMQRIWGIKEANTLSSGLVPTRACKHWSTDVFKSTIIACNGRDRDKPIQIKSDFTVEYLVDKASSSNAAVPKAEFVLCTQGYVIFINTEYGLPFVELSAKGTDGTFSRDPNPADSVEIDLSMITSTVRTEIIGAGVIRDKVYAAFYDKGMVGAVGIYDSDGKHTPDFSDTISENGTVSHRTIVSLGNDILMCDYAGVPSVAISQQSAVFTPVRLSELIAPSIQAHLSTLSEETLRYKSFAFFNKNDRTYMLFLPIYDEVTRSLSTDPFLFNDTLRNKDQAVIRLENHGLMENSYVDISGANNIGSANAADINGRRKVLSVINQDYVVVQLGDAPNASDDTYGGGSNVTITPVNNEMIGYIFEFNREFKIRRWTRYRGWNFACGCASQRSKVFLCKGQRIYRMGDNEVPLFADFVDEYDHYTWSNSTMYYEGDRVRDQATGEIFEALRTQESSASGTFADERSNNEELWTDYIGRTIDWVLETPWSDMRERGRQKTNHYISIDSEGQDNFTVSAFVNKLRNNSADNSLVPVRSIQFAAGDTGGWDANNPGNWGSGRRTREEKVWPFRIRGKLIRWRFEGKTRKKVKITSLTMYYKMGNIR